jgi:hypothetical protein
MVAVIRVDGPTREVTEDLEAVHRQRELIVRVHSRGGEVVLSCHRASVLSEQKATRLGTLMAGREEISSKS